MITYEYWNNYINKIEIIKKFSYKRLTYLLYLINNINLKYIEYNDLIYNIYDNIKDNINFSYWDNKKFIKKNKIKIPYNYIYYFMKIKYPDIYLNIKYELKGVIIKLFLYYEKLYNNNKKYIQLKKKFLNYHYILYKIFEVLNINKIYFNY